MSGMAESSDWRTALLLPSAPTRRSYAAVAVLPPLVLVLLAPSLTAAASAAVLLLKCAMRFAKSTVSSWLLKWTCSDGKCVQDEQDEVCSIAAVSRGRRPAEIALCMSACSAAAF